MKATTAGEDGGDCAMKEASEAPEGASAGLPGTIGSTVNQLTASVDNLSVTIENLSAANSQIKDADLAAESADFTRNQVLMQAGTSMLSQANSIPQLALSLLG